MKTILYIDRQIDTTINFVERLSDYFQIVATPSVDLALQKIKNGFKPCAIVCAAYQNKQTFEGFFEYFRNNVSQDAGLVAILGSVNDEDKQTYNTKFNAGVCRLIDSVEFKKNEILNHLNN